MQDPAAATEAGGTIARYEEFLRSDPGNTLLRLNLGDLCHRAGRFEQAQAHFEACLPDAVYRATAQAHLGKLKLSQNLPAEAQAQFETLIAAGSDDPELHHNLGIALYAQGRWADSQAAFELARSKGLATGATLRYIAYCLHQQNRTAEAREFAQRWLDAAPSEESLGYLSVLELHAGDRAAADRHAEETLRINPDNADAAYVKTVGHIERQEMDQAERLLTRLLERHPDSFRALQGMGMVHYHRREFDKAISFLECALKIVPRQVGTLVTVGWAWMAKNDVINAERAFRRAIAAEPSFGEGHGGLATALAFQRRVKEASDAIRVARRLDRKSFGAVYAQSVLLALQGRKEAAEELVEHALQQPVMPDGSNIAESVATYIRQQGLGPPPGQQPPGPRSP
jgi:tetratricopeptide (TPR) repeat protein